MNFINRGEKGITRLAMLGLAGTLVVESSYAQKLSSTDVKKLTGSAKSSADHLKLAKHYEAIAVKHDAEAKEHEMLAEQYTKQPTGHEQKHPMSAETAGHCKYYAEHCRKAAAAARQIAASHTEMAKQSAK